VIAITYKPLFIKKIVYGKGACHYVTGAFAITLGGMKAASRGLV